jgi:hypothetical protein
MNSSGFILIREQHLLSFYQHDMIFFQNQSPTYSSKKSCDLFGLNSGNRKEF